MAFSIKDVSICVQSKTQIEKLLSEGYPKHVFCCCNFMFSTCLLIDFIAPKN